MSNSNLATLKVPAYEGNYTKGRDGRKIEKITIHHMAARWTAQRCGESFQVPGRKGSSHYGIGYNGEIAQYVDEENTAYTDSNWDSNCTSVTIENANISSGGDWPVSDATLDSLIKLVADIAIRNNLGLLVKEKNLTWHKMYAATACPGPYLLEKMDYIIEEANKLIGGDVITSITPVQLTYQAYDGAWLGNITEYDINNQATGFAGVIGNPMSGVYINSSVGNVYYKVHIKDGEWLPEVKNREGYAGILEKPIDAIMIYSDSTTIRYRAHAIGKGWLGEISGYDEKDHNYGYAGWQGYAIDAIAMKADDIITVNVIEKPKVEEPAPEPKKHIYRIRLSWADAKSQIGAYSNLESAKKQCPEGYTVYDEEGIEVFHRIAVEPAPEPPKNEDPEVILTPAAPAADSEKTPKKSVWKILLDFVINLIKSFFTK